MKKKALKNKVSNATIILRAITLLTILSFPGIVKGQTDVTSMKLPAVPQGASVVFDVIHAGNYFFALSYDKLLVFDENGDYTTKFSLGGDFGKFNPISDGSQDYNYLCYNNNAGVVYAMKSDLGVLAVKDDLSDSWSFDPDINQQGASLNDSMQMMNGRMIMRMDNEHNRLYMLVSAMDVNNNPPGQFHSFKHCFLIYDIDITGTWTLFYDDYLGTESNYEDQINNVIFNEDPDKNFYYISRLGNPIGVIEVWEVTANTVEFCDSLTLHNPDYPGGGATVRYQFGKMLSIYEPSMNKILVFPRKYRTTKPEQFFARICVIDGDHDDDPANINYDSIDSPSKKIHDAVFLTENNDLIVSFPQSEELSQNEDLNDKDIAVYHFDGTDFIPALNFGYATENNTLQLDIFDDNASLKMHQINDRTALISKKDGLIKFEFMDTDYSASPVINAESNFYGNGAKGATYSCMINNAASQLDFVKNSNGELYDEKSTSLAYPAYYATANADGSKLYFYNTLHAHNTGLYIWADDGEGLVNINNDTEESNNITSAIGDCVYNPFTGHFLISENTQYENAPARVIVINDNGNNEFVQNIELTHNNEDADFAGEMFVAPNEKLYVMANMRCADPKPKIFVFDANDYDYLSTIQLSSLVYDDSTAFFTGYFTYNPHDQGVYATLVPIFYSPDPYHTAKNSMYMNLGYEDYTGKGYIIRLSDGSYEQLDFPGKIIVPERGNWGNESQYDDYLFTIGKKFYFLDYTEGTINVNNRDEIFNDITYSPVHDKLFALRDEEDSDREDRKIQIYAIDMLENGSPVFEKLDQLVYAGQAAGIFHNPIDNYIYVYHKFDDAKLGEVPVKLLYFDPSEENPQFDSIPLGFTSYYPELDHCKDYYEFYFYNIIEPYFNINDNRAFFPNGGFSTVSMIQLESRDVLNLRSGITWLSFPRIEDRDPDGYVPSIPVLENNISTPAYTDLLLQNLPPQQDLTVSLTWDQDLSWDNEDLPFIKSTLGYKLTLEPSSVRYLSIYGTTPAPGSSDADVELYNGYENWVGYYLPETQSIFDAIPEDVLDDIIEIKHQDWFVYNQNLPDPPPPDGSCRAGWKCGSNVEHNIRYGEMVMIRTFYNDHTFQWISSGNTASGGLLETEYYQFEEQADYTAVYIEPDTTENPMEIGAFVNDTCIGAATVGQSDTLIELRAYTDSSNTGNIVFEEHYGFKSSPEKISEYMVENPRTGQMQMRSIHSGEKQLYFNVSFRKDKNNKDQHTGRDVLKLNCIPNPVTNSCRIQYELAAKTFVKLEVFDIYGNHQNTIYSGHSEGGTHEISWDIHDSKGNALPNGVYLISLETAEQKTQLKIVITK